MKEALERELRQLEAWLDSPPSLWAEQTTAVDGPFYQTTLASIILPPQDWLKRRVQVGTIAYWIA